MALLPYPGRMRLALQIGRRSRGPPAPVLKRISALRPVAMLELAPGKVPAPAPMEPVQVAGARARVAAAAGTAPNRC
jgi:glycolate oxidase iron-sulfur subunit